MGEGGRARRFRTFSYGFLDNEINFAELRFEVHNQGGGRGLRGIVSNVQQRLLGCRRNKDWGAGLLEHIFWH